MKRYLTALALAGTVDAICYMIVAPSIIFYVTEEAGGNKNQYGIILSAFSFASFCVKPFLGHFSDTHGFKTPYLISLLVAALGGLVYFIASTLPSGNIAVGAILFSRILGGVGAASSALGFAYVARMIPRDQQTSVNSVLSMVRSVGMAAGPGFNALLANVNISMFNGRLKIDPLNSVGLVMLVSNLISAAVLQILLDEPQPEEHNHKLISVSKGESLANQKSDKFSRRDIVNAVISPDIIVPFFTIFSFNSCFQLVETGFAPAAYDALGWRTVKTSSVLGSVSFVIMFNMLLVSQLSSKFKVRDTTLLIFGLSMAAFGYSAVYLLWARDAATWHFIFPFFFAVGSFPFLGAPNRSIFTDMMNKKPPLEEHHGLMQAVLSMVSSLAGFVTPTFVAIYCLRSPAEVSSSRDGRELTAWALYAPVLLLFSLAGVVYLLLSNRLVNDKITVQSDIDLSSSEEQILNENSTLLPQTKVTDTPKEASRRPTNEYHHTVAMHRQSSTECMGLTHCDGHIEHHE